MNAQDYNEHIMFLGDSSKCSNYLSFAKKKAKELYNQAKSINAQSFSQTYKVDGASIDVRINGKHIKIIITAKEDKANIYFVNGISRYNDNKNKSLKEFIYKGDTSFLNLPQHGISPAPFVSTLGYNTQGKTQHNFIKGSKYTGVMKHIIQNMLSQNKQIGYRFDWEETDGAIVELVRTRNELVNDSYNVEVFKDITLKRVKISKNGVFLTDGNYIVNPAIVYDKTNLGFCGKTSDLDINLKYNQQYLKLDCLFEQTKFDTTNITPLISPIEMSQFYNKQPFFKSCGWLFLNNPVKSEHTQINEDSYSIKTTHLMFNTCYDATKSYLYAIEIVSNGIYDRTSQNIFTTTYTAKLHLVMEGKLSSLPSWLFGNSGLYIPNETQNKVELFNKVYQENVTDILDFAPVYCLETAPTGFGFLDTSDDFFFNQSVNLTSDGVDFIKIPQKRPDTTYNSNCNIKVIGLIDIIKRNINVNITYDNQQDQYGDYDNPIITRDFSSSIKNVIVDTHKNLITNNYTVDLPIVYNGNDLEVFNYSGYTITIPQLIKNNKTYYADGGVFINGIGNFTKNNQAIKSIIKSTTKKTYTQEAISSYETQMQLYKGINYEEKIIIPMDDRNSIISIYTYSSLSGELNPLDGYMYFPLRYDENYLSSQAIYYLNTNYTQYVSSFVTKEYFYIYPGYYFVKDSQSNLVSKKYSIIGGGNYFTTKINNYIKTNTQYIGVSLILDVSGEKFVYSVEDNVNTINYINGYPVFNNYQSVCFIGKP